MPAHRRKVAKAAVAHARRMAAETVLAKKEKMVRVVAAKMPARRTAAKVAAKMPARRTAAKVPARRMAAKVPARRMAAKVVTALAKSVVPCSATALAKRAMAAKVAATMPARRMAARVVVTMLARRTAAKVVATLAKKVARDTAAVCLIVSSHATLAARAAKATKATRATRAVATADAKRVATRVVTDRRRATAKPKLPCLQLPSLILPLT